MGYTHVNIFICKITIIIFVLRKDDKKKEKIVISLWIKELKDKHGSNVADKMYVETFLRETWLKIIFVSSSLVNQFLVLRINTFHIVNWLKFYF